MRPPFAALLIPLFFISAAPGLEPAAVFGPNRPEGRAGRIYVPEKPDGRIVMMIREHAEPHAAPTEADLGEVTRMVTDGCTVALIQIPPRNGVRAYNDYLHERVWRGALNDMRGLLPKMEERLVLLPPGHRLLDPVPFHTRGNRTLYLDISVPSGGKPFPGYLRVNSGAYGLDLPMFFADNGFAVANITDPFEDLKLKADEAFLMIRAAARVFRQHTEAHGHNGRLGLGGRSKHGMAAAILGAGGTHADVPPNERVQAVIAMTDVLDLPTRAEDFAAAGHRINDSSGDADDPRGSPVRLLDPGAPAFYLCDAHGRRSRQVERMIEALQRVQASFAQGWDEKLPNFRRKTPDNILAFLREYL